ncbi:cation:proton antiporter [Micromonospora sp. WMMA1363]|uniref:cation:proton antiporter n=1 Tax=Micromonospora sp. WMMA1363 TaxID=3053985 RepID=UPI00259CB4CC|nr:cation:proton antiporter [Micromonospora sp. WMMA1363]MDM4723523.1 cation:proton antiporter [Micromonospora sp. WMMA1363]
MSDSRIGISLILLLVVTCQITASRLRIPAIILLLPAGLLAGAVGLINPSETFGPIFRPLVSIGIAVVVFEAALDLDFTQLKGIDRQITRRLLVWGVPITWAGAGLLASTLLGLPAKAAIMLGAILIVSGPTVVNPLLEFARPNATLMSILRWESTTLDPIGALIGVLVFHALLASEYDHPVRFALEFAFDVIVGISAGILGAALLWLVFRSIELSNSTRAVTTIAVVVADTAFCNVLRQETGLTAALTIGIALASLPGLKVPITEQVRRAIGEMIIGMLFIAISAGVSLYSLRTLFWPSLGIAAGLMVIIRPAVAALATARTTLTYRERIVIASMYPRGIVAAFTATAFSSRLTTKGLAGAEDLLPTTFLVIAVTVTGYGFTAQPLMRWLGHR